ncbi:MAG: hypothetical protein Q7S62_02005 [bacterium]|nr:hypothetical protein [bacterium]
MLTIVIASIVVITCAAWLVNKVLPFKVCPICAGVSGTWLWMLVALFVGYEIDRIIVAMLLGGSVVGIAYQLEKRLPAGRSPILWKALFIPAGFVVAYSLVSLQWALLAVSLGVVGVIVWAFVMAVPKQRANQKVEELKQKMENCC